MNAIGEQISAILWNVFNRPRLIDLIDILLLTIIIYELLVHVRQTRVSQTIKGIIILLLATWLSDVLGMRTIHALLAWMINAGPVLLIVLFQSEIRRILEELGNNSVFDGTGRIAQEGNTELIIDEMILALEHMARRKVGALIVIENKIRLNDVIATGTHVDGLISQPLIENIFEPNTPLHDGAVVIRGDRVIAAACLLRGSRLGHAPPRGPRRERNFGCKGVYCLRGDGHHFHGRGRQARPPSGRGIPAADSPWHLRRTGQGRPCAAAAFQAKEEGRP